MKMTYTAAAALSCLLLLGAGSSVSEAHGHWSHGHRGCGGYYCEPRCDVYGQGELEADPQIMRAPTMQSLNGTITSIEGRMVEVESEDGRSIVALLNRDTYIIDGAKGNLRLPGALQVGQKVSLYHSRRMTRSIPPQAAAYAVILGEAQDTPLFFPVAKVQLAENGKAVRVLNGNNDIIATIDGAACPDYAQITPGDRLLVWTKMMTMSLPAQTKADKAVILP